MAVVAVASWRIIPGHGPQFAANVATAKKIHERLGARVRVLQSGPGPRPLTISYVTEFDDMVKYGEFSEKLSSDSEWQKFWTQAQVDPSGQLLEQTLAQDVDIR